MKMTYHTRKADMKDFLATRLNNGDVPEPNHVFVPAEEMYMTENVSTSHMYDPENCWREFVASRGVCCTRSLSDAIRTELSNPYGSFGYYSSGSYGL